MPRYDKCLNVDGMATMWRSSADMHVTVPYNNIFLSILYVFNQPSEVDFGIALVVDYLRFWAPFQYL